MATKRKRTISRTSAEGNEIVPSKLLKKPKSHARLCVSKSHIYDKAGLVLCTGGGDVGQLGLGPDILEKSRVALVKLNKQIVDVCAGGMHTVCLSEDGKVITFGCNDEGALGRNTSDKEDAEFYPEEVELPAKVVQISAGDSHTAALLEDGRVFAWGTFRDSHGNMGMTPQGNEKLPYEIWPETNVIKIASGADHLVLLTNQGQILTCGCAEQGQLGRAAERGSSRYARGGIARLLHPTPVNFKLSLKLHFDDIWAGTYCTFAKVLDKDEIYVFGLNNYSQLGLNQDKLATCFSPTLSKDFSKHKWAQICSGQHHSVALDVNGKTYSIGRKEYGRLGLGKGCEDALELQEIPVLADKKVIYISTGTSFSFAVTDKGELFAWGMGSSGQLGTGEEEDCEVPTLVKSKQLENKIVFKVGGGGQHTVVLAVDNSSINNNDKK